MRVLATPKWDPSDKRTPGVHSNLAFYGALLDCRILAILPTILPVVLNGESLGMVAGWTHAHL